LAFCAAISPGSPNGRRVGDDVLDIALQAMAGATPLTPEFVRAPNDRLGDGVDGNDRPYLDRFPFLTTPNTGRDNSGGPTIPRNTPQPLSN
jgi:hypothetical protein